jgi:TP901-1 family phage major tail protein
MSAQKGKDLLLKLDETGTGNFTTVAGLRSHAFSLNSRSIDTTHAQSTGQWRELLDGAGPRSASVQGSGIFRDQTADATVRQLFFDGEIRDWQVIVPDFGVMQGAFQLVQLSYAGQYDGEVTYQLNLESAGAISFTAA